MPNLFRDLRYAMRQLRKAPGFTFVCVLTLALGIGANTAIFTLVDAVMLKSLPVAKPKELWRLGNTFNCCINGRCGYGSWSIYSYEMYKLFRDHTPEFEDMAAFQSFVPNFSVRRSGNERASAAIRRRVRFRQLFSDVRHWSVCRANDFTRLTISLTPPGCRNQLSRLATILRARSLGDWFDHHG